MKRLLLVERIIIESLSHGAADIETLQERSGIHHDILNRALKNLIINQLVAIDKKQYKLKSENITQWKTSINSNCNLKGEVKELLEHMVNQFFTCPDRNMAKLKLKKVWMNPTEEKIFNALTYNLVSFLSNLEKDQKKLKDKNVIHKKVVVFGEISYQNLLDDFLQAV